MTLNLSRTLIEGLIRQFRRAAIVTHFGYQDENEAMQTAGIDSAREAIDVLDSFGSNMRSAPLPLLEDPDWGVRDFAATYLIKTHARQALETLRETLRRVSDFGPHHARLSPAWRS